MNITYRPAQSSDIEEIKPYILEYCLDGEKLDYKQFYIVEYDGQIAGFGRIKCYGQIYEIATLGVIEKYRNSGIGKNLVKKLIKLIPAEEVWITTIIPDFFEQLGFVRTDAPPEEIFSKCRRICGELHKTTKNSYFMYYKKSVFT